MSYNDHKDKSKEQNIRKLLNDSLELEGINVSEDLINKTLDAINQQDMAPVTADTSKMILWNKYMRRFAGAVAAVFVIVACFSMMKLFPGMGGKKSMSTDQAAYDTAEQKYSIAEYDSNTASGNANGLDGTTENKTDTADTTKTAGTTASSDVTNNSDAPKDKETPSASETGQTKENGESQTLKSSVIKESVPSKKSDVNKESSKKSLKKVLGNKNDTAYADASGKKSTPETDTTNTADIMKNEDITSAPDASAKKTATVDTQTPDQNEADTAPKFALKMADDNELKFSDFCTVTAGDAAYIKITDSVSNTSITLIGETQIQEFIACMGKYQFTARELSTEKSSFTIEIECPYVEPNRYSISIGECLTIQYTADQQMKESVYQITDYEKLKEDLSSLMEQYRK